MILDIPYVYRATVILARKRSYDTVGVRARMPVKIAEASRDDAPLAAVLTWTDANDETHRVPYREHRGGLMRPWMPVREVEGWLAAHPMDASPFVRRTWSKAPDAIINDGEPVQVWHGDDRLEVTGAIAAAASRLVAVDGMLWQPSLGPVWVVHGWSEPGNPIGVQARNGDDAAAWLASNLFRGDRLEDALGHAHAEAALRGEADRPVVTNRAIEVLRPQAFTWDDDWSALWSALKRAVKCNQVATWPRVVLGAWYDVRDLVAALPPDTPYCADAHAAAQSLSAAIDATGSRGRVWIDGLDQLDAALRRYERVSAPALAATDAPAAPTPGLR